MSLSSHNSLLIKRLPSGGIYKGHDNSTMNTWLTHHSCWRWCDNYTPQSAHLGGGSYKLSAKYDILEYQLSCIFEGNIDGRLPVVYRTGPPMIARPVAHDDHMSQLQGVQSWVCKSLSHLWGGRKIILPLSRHLWWITMTHENRMWMSNRPRLGHALYGYIHV